MRGRREPVSRRDRPAKAPLSRAGVVAVALRVMREEGLEKVTMRRLATELDTGPASLYVYVENMAELHGAVLDELLADFEPPVAAGTGWRDGLVGVLGAYTQLLLGFPSLARSVLMLRPAGPNYVRLVDRLLGLLEAGEVPPRQAAWGVDLLLQHATATAAEQGTRDGSADAAREEELLMTAVGEASGSPHLTRVAGELFAGTGEQRLRWAFTALVDGIAATPAP